MRRRRWERKRENQKQKAPTVGHMCVYHDKPLSSTSVTATNTFLEGLIRQVQRVKVWPRGPERMIDLSLL